MKPAVNIMWFRRDLRLEDNAALYQALTGDLPVVPVFIFDTNILDDLEDKRDRRITFIYKAIMEMQMHLVTLSSSVEVYNGLPGDVFIQLLSKYNVRTVYANHDYEQYAIDRDKEIRELLEQKGIQFITYKDHVIFEKNEVVKDDGKPYTVFTPYSKRWKATLNELYLKSYPTEKYFNNFFKQDAQKIMALSSIDFIEIDEDFPSKEVRKQLIKEYDKYRDFPSIPGTSRLSVHLRFGTISIRELVRKTKELNETFLNELIWRDFYHMVLWHMPHVRKGHACKPEYDRIEWRNNEQEFDAWCNGMTGYPIVDAGMRELNATGFMHNRVRMITASFLCKHLLIDWRWGESYFAHKLLDYDFAANNGGWQWSAGSGCDAAPYFRIFSPKAQTEKFDKDLKYIRKWIPELDSFHYPKPIVDHEFARKRCLEVYKKALVK
jgi:deoxyribodipyrimidine photo-lyase